VKKKELYKCVSPVILCSYLKENLRKNERRDYFVL